MMLDRWLTPALLRLKDCVCTELARSVGGPVARSGLIWSDLPILDGCECGCELNDQGQPCSCTAASKGRAYVRLASGEAVAQPPATGPCLNRGWDMTIQIGVARCTIGCAPDLRPDSDEETMFLTAAADLLAVRRAVVCCNKALPQNVSLTERAWQTLGPEGCCYGGELAVIVRVP